MGEAAWSRPSMAFVPFFLLLALDLPSLLLVQSRDSEPLVVTGEQVDLPVSPHLLVGFRREEGSWVQVPVQVDERHEVDWDAVKQVDCRVHLRELTSLLYSDPETYLALNVYVALGALHLERSSQYVALGAQ